MMEVLINMSLGAACVVVLFLIFSIINDYKHMKKCPKCGKKNYQFARRCERCGHKYNE